MSAINKILDVKLQRNGITGAPFMTALVDFDLDGSNVILSVSFEYCVNAMSEITTYGKNEDGETVCFVLNVEGMVDGTLKHHYRGDSLAFDHAQEIIDEYQKRSVTYALGMVDKMDAKTTLNKILAVDSQRNGVSGLPFMTALVDFDIDGNNEILSVSFAYEVNDAGELSAVALNEYGEAICFVLNVEDMMDGSVHTQYAGDDIATQHVASIIAEYRRLDDLKWQQLGLIP